MNSSAKRKKPNQEYSNQQSYLSEWKRDNQRRDNKFGRENEFSRQLEMKGVSHHYTGLMRYVNGIYLSWKERALISNKKTIESKISLVNI